MVCIKKARLRHRGAWRSQAFLSNDNHENEMEGKRDEG